jgi:fructokinase
MSAEKIAKKNRLQPLIFGEVLFDSFPDNTQVLGGAPFNIAWNLRSLGLNPLFVSRVGSDRYGDKIKDAMSAWDMNTEYLQTDSQHPTGIVSVTFNNNEPAYEIVENSAWDFISETELQNIPNIPLLYHGTLGLRNSVAAHTLSNLKKKTSGKIFLDVNLRPPYWNKGLIQQQFEECHYLKLNENELQLLAGDGQSAVDQAKTLLTQYDIECIFVTLGKNGAFAIDKPGNHFQVKPKWVVDVVDTVGAGDAFSSVLIMGILLDWDISTMMQRAQTLAEAIVGLQGASTQDKAFYKQLSKDWS